MLYQKPQEEEKKSISTPISEVWKMLQEQSGGDFTISYSPQKEKAIWDLVQRISDEKNTVITLDPYSKPFRGEDGQMYKNYSFFDLEELFTGFRQGYFTIRADEESEKRVWGMAEELTRNTGKWVGIETARPIENVAGIGVKTFYYHSEIKKRPRYSTQEEDFERLLDAEIEERRENGELDEPFFDKMGDLHTHVEELRLEGEVLGAKNINHICDNALSKGIIDIDRNLQVRFDILVDEGFEFTENWQKDRLKKPVDDELAQHWLYSNKYYKKHLTLTGIKKIEDGVERTDRYSLIFQWNNENDPDHRRFPTRDMIRGDGIRRYAEFAKKKYKDQQFADTQEEHLTRFKEETEMFKIPGKINVYGLCSDPIKNGKMVDADHSDPQIYFYKGRYGFEVLFENDFESAMDRGEYADMLVAIDVYPKMEAGEDGVQVINYYPISKESVEHNKLDRADVYFDMQRYRFSMGLEGSMDERLEVFELLDRYDLVPPERVESDKRYDMFRPSDGEVYELSSRVDYRQGSCDEVKKSIKMIFGSG